LDKNGLANSTIKKGDINQQHVDT